MPSKNLFKQSGYHFSNFERKRLLGRGFTHIRHLDVSFLIQYEESDNEILLLIKRLDLYCSRRQNSIQRCVRDLTRLLCLCTNFDTRYSMDESSDKVKENARTVYYFGGVLVLVHILLQDTVFPPDTWHTYETEEKLRLKSLAMEVLTKLITIKHVGQHICDSLRDDKFLLDYLFTLLAYETTCIYACQLIEDILQSKQEVFNLNHISNIREIVSRLTGNERQFGTLCRILAITISDLDMYDNKISLYSQNKQKQSSGFVNVRDINQDLLLNIPELLPQLVKLVIDKEYVPRFQGLTSELDCWMEWIESEMSQELSNRTARPDAESFVGGINEPTSVRGDLVPQQGLYITEELMNRVEIVYVLGLFLLGKHRKKVQRKLAEFLLAPGLCDLFDQFIWKIHEPRHAHRSRLRGHSITCECSPEVALKIQFLRLIHSFCDHSEYKHLLLSKNELSELKQINSTAPPEECIDLEPLNKQLMCRGKKGLLTKIVEVMLKEWMTSTYRFWLARAVESYLRGSTSYCDQIFLKKRGLLNHIASNIVDNEIRHKEILQSSFDLLGELIKFNIISFQSFDDLLNTKEKLDKFLAIINKNLVDSNMFLRSMVLSVEHFNKETTTKRGRSSHECKLSAYISDFNTQIQYIYRLIKIINVENLTQENVSCLNTTLVFLMFAHGKRVLPRYLAALSHFKDGKPASDCILKNFRELLLFWQDHYLHKDKDCSALEKSSRISFDYWKETVSILVSDDGNTDTAILSYIPTCAPTYSERNH